MSDTVGVPPGLRSRLALVTLLGVFLIPIVSSSLRGLTHVITCRRAAEIPFTITIPEDGPADIISAVTLERGEDSALCGGLRLRPAVGRAGPGKVAVTLAIENQTDFTWRGSAELHLGATAIPVSIGRIRPGATASDTLELRVDEGTHELDGTLLIGP